MSAETPYRNKLPVINNQSKTEQKELAICLFCKWREFGHRQANALCWHADFIRFDVVEGIYFSSKAVFSVNIKGKCKRYEPSIFTKIVRLLGLRRPKWLKDFK